MRVTFVSTIGSVHYELDTKLGSIWAPFVVEAFKKQPISRGRWNHQIAWPEDYENIDGHWASLKAVANVVGVTLPESPYQQALNLAHREFVEAVRVRGSNNRDWWHGLNTGIHFMDHLIQNRGPNTTLDFNGTFGPQPLPQGSRAEPIVDGGLYALYNTIGRCWDEVWRASDYDVPIAHFVQQSSWNASCLMSHHDLKPDEAREEEVWASRSDWGITKPQRQRGLFRLGYRVSELPPEWRSGTIINVLVSN